MVFFSCRVCFFAAALSGVFFCQARASSSSAPLRSFEREDGGIHQIVVKAHALDLRITPSEGGGIQARFGPEISESFKEGVLMFGEKNFPSSKKPRSVKKGNTLPRVQLRLPGGQRIKILLFSGRIVMHRLSFQKLELSVRDKSHTQIKNTKGDMRVFQSSGEVSVTSHRGAFQFQSQDARLKAQSLKGGGRIKTLKGHIQISQSSGSFEVHSFQAPLVFRKLKGTLSFSAEKGGVYLRGWTGSVTGYSRQGEIRGQLDPTGGEVRMETHSAPMHLDFPHSRAHVQAESWEGRLRVPRYFYRTKAGGIDRSRGRLKGTKSSGSVTLKSHSGSITVYQSR